MSNTIRFWEDIMSGKYNVFISQTTAQEIRDCEEPKRSVLLKHIKEANLAENIIVINDSIKTFAQQIIDDGILSQKSYDDCLHIASAVLNNCDVIVSWNFKHLVRYKTVNGVRALSLKNNHKLIDIITPTELIDFDEE
jgi:predicted nucleic acid-binding protein